MQLSLLISLCLLAVFSIFLLILDFKVDNLFCDKERLLIHFAVTKYYFYLVKGLTGKRFDLWSILVDFLGGFYHDSFDLVDF